MTCTTFKTCNDCGEQSHDTICACLMKTCKHCGSENLDDPRWNKETGWWYGEEAPKPINLWDLISIETKVHFIYSWVKSNGLDFTEEQIRKGLEDDNG